MDLNYSAENEAFREEVRVFLEEHWLSRPNPTKEDEDEVRRLATERGYLYRNVPEYLGGSGQEPDVLKAILIREEFNKVKAPVELRDRGIYTMMPTLIHYGTEEQKQYFIPKTLTGEFRWCQGYSEPGAGSDLASLRTKAELKDGKWIINGQKIWSSDAHKATHMFMLARTEPDAPKHDGITYLLLDLRQPGVTIRPIVQVTGEAEFNEVFFDNAETPEDWMVGERGRGWHVSRTTLVSERNNLNGVYFHSGMFKRIVRLAGETMRNGKPAIEDPSIRERLAAYEGWLMATTYSTFRTLSMNAAGQNAGRITTMMKLNGSEMAQELYRIGRDIIGDDMMLMLPGKDGVGHRDRRAWVRHVFSALRLSIAGGTSNIQRNIIAERGLGLPRDERIK